MSLLGHLSAGGTTSGRLERGLARHRGERASDEQRRGDGRRQCEDRADPECVVEAVDVGLWRAVAEGRAGGDERAERPDADRDPAWRNMSLTPAARPHCSGGAELSATCAERRAVVPPHPPGSAVSGNAM